MIRGYEDVYPSVVEGRYAAILIHHPERVEGEVPRRAGVAGDKLCPLKNPKVYKVELTRRMRQFHPMEATVYILRCRDGSYYTGLTKQPVEARVWEHNAGIYEGYTSKRLPVELVFTETYDRIIDAIERERQIKGWSRWKKEALIALAYEALPELSRRKSSMSNSDR